MSKHTIHKVQTATTETLTKDSSMDLLTPEEEKVLRMLHGLTEGDDHQLKFALGASEETMQRLALMEMHLIETMKASEFEGSLQIEEEDCQTKQRIIESLRKK